MGQYFYGWEKKSKAELCKPTKKEICAFSKVLFPNPTSRGSSVKISYHVGTGHQPIVTALNNVDIIFVKTPNKIIFFEGIKLDVHIFNNFYFLKEFLIINCYVSIKWCYF